MNTGLNLTFDLRFLTSQKGEEMNKLKPKITIENALCLYIILCPVLDMVSFLFRNAFKTSLSPSTFIRPLITTIIAIIIFFKCKFKREINICRTYICYIWNYSPILVSNSKDRNFV